ncbi:hypothetical protein ALC56_11211 [Trachymyrmex septentrionalis]|uniref:Uncharacterized protein n=1 Tax=Trachymyrmex septentrionalis TaxID=34720 RepID=A0A195F3G5_9HYME|nr:hypothetical protein ALC56_11211 [Trachymyrmex septentrionalis]
MQSSCLVKYTTRSLYIRTLVVHTYQRRSSSTDPRTIPCYGAIPAGHKEDRSSLPEVTKEASTSSSPIRHDIAATAATPAPTPSPGPGPPPGPPSTGPYRPNGPEGPSAPTFTALLSQRPLNRTSHTFPPDANNASVYFNLLPRVTHCKISRSCFVPRAVLTPPHSVALRANRRYKHSSAHNLAIGTSCILHTIMMPPILNIMSGISSRFVDKSCRQIDLEPGVCPSDFWIGAIKIQNTQTCRETPGTERHHEEYFTRIEDKAHIVFASPTHFFFLIRTNGGLILIYNMGPLSYDRNSP